jgi:dephospho-CoA kinase
MLKVGITGGIGSGKTVVCQVFHTLGIPVFYADEAAKFLMEHDEELIKNIQSVFGKEVYEGKKLQREKLAAMVFNQTEKLELLNSLVHPTVGKQATKWMQQQTTPYAIKEAAILFESGSYKDLDKIIGVYSPKELRVQRVLKRDSSTTENVMQRMAKQMDEEEKMKRCDFVIINDGKEAILPQVLKIHQQLLELASKHS